MLLPNTKIKLPSIAELTAGSNPRHAELCLETPVLPSTVPQVANVDMPLSAVPRNAGPIPQDVVLQSGNPVGNTQYQLAQMPTSLPYIPQFPTYRYAPFDPVQYTQVQYQPMPMHPQLAHGQQPFKNYFVYHLQAGPMSMTPPASMFTHSQQVSPLMPMVEVTSKPVHRCQRCGTTETPEWRRGPNGLRTLCNACGLFHAKLVKKKGAAIAAAEVLNNKVYKGSNGRRVVVKKYNVNQDHCRQFGSQWVLVPWSCFISLWLRVNYMLARFGAENFFCFSVRQSLRSQLILKNPITYTSLHFYWILTTCIITFF